MIRDEYLSSNSETSYLPKPRPPRNEEYFSAANVSPNKIPIPQPTHPLPKPIVYPKSPRCLYGRLPYDYYYDGLYYPYDGIFPYDDYYDSD